MKFWRYFLVVSFWWIFWGSTVFGNAGFFDVEKNVRQSLVDSNYRGEYTETVFRFGRRQETNYFFTSYNKKLIYQVLNPSWQHGELVLSDRKKIVYYLPAQNKALKVNWIGNQQKFHLKFWEPWLKWINKSEGQILLNGRETLIFSGKRRNKTFKLWINKKNYLPLAIEIYHNSLLVRSIRTINLEEIDFVDTERLIPATVRWYQNELKFWQEVSLYRIQTGVSFKIKQPKYLPMGYKFLEAQLQELSLASVVQLIYTKPNGERLNLFERETLSNKQQPHSEQWKKITIVTGRTLSVHQWKQDGISLTLLGELPMSEMEKIAKSVP